MKNNMKKTIFLFLIFYLFFTSQVSAFWQKKFFREEIKSTISAIKEEVKPTIAAVREQTKEAIRLTITASPSAKPWQIRKEIREQNKGLLEQIKNQVKEKLYGLKFNAKVVGKITEIGENYLKVSDNKDGKVYRVNISEKTQLRRRFWGKSSLKEFAVGDEVNVIGRFLDEEKTIIDAVLIRNHSIQRRWGVFFGKVLSKEGNTLKIETINRGELKVYVENTVKLVNRRGEAIGLGDIQLGHRIRIKGVWDKDLKEIREVEEIKDFSLPPLPTKLPTSTKED